MTQTLSGSAVEQPNTSPHDEVHTSEGVLLQSIAQVGSVAISDVEQMKEEMRPFLPDADINYADFQNGQWRLLALYNNSGDPTDTTVREGENVVPTALLDAMPSVRKVINGFFAEKDIVLARIARLSPGGRLWEHVDYTELDESMPRRRFHFPIQTEPEATFVTGGRRIHMPIGSVIQLNPRGAHGVIHEGKQDRVHILVDASTQDTTSLSAPYLQPGCVTKLPSMSDNEVMDTERLLADMISSGDLDFAIAQGLDLFYRRLLPTSTTTHKVIAHAFELAGNAVEAEVWYQNNEKYMGGMFKHD